MTPINDGGPAFPFPGWVHPSNSDGNIHPELGMTLRDYFAAAALTGLIASATGEPLASDYARESYRLADAMLAARVGAS